MLAQDASVDGHVVYALLGLLFDDFEHQVHGEVFWTAHTGDGLVNRNRAYRNWRGFDDGFADFRNVAAGREVHHGVGAIVDRVMEFFQLLVNVGSGGRVADVRIDFAFECDADAHRLEIAMMNVGGDDGAAAGDLATDELGLDFFAFGDVGHLLSDDILAGQVHLGHVSRAVGIGFVGFAFFDPTITEWHKSPKEVRPAAELGCLGPPPVKEKYGIGWVRRQLAAAGEA